MTSQHALIFANGDPADGTMVRRTLSYVETPYVIAADGGVRVAKFFGVGVDTVIGDMDSIPDDDYLHLKHDNITLIQHPPQKDFTDLELALMHAVERGITWIRIIGAIGGRFDQTLANVYLLALPILMGRDVALVAGEQSISLLPAGVHSLEGQVGDTLSLIPLGGDVEKIRTDGLQYPLHDETLHFGPARGVSNVFLFPTITLHIGKGQLLVIHTNGRA
ncbi:MAG: thiamine diphosphokinase [Anaerolineae bacterium]|jgi:thiamine pyrophosphokinase|nr:thiamine diphosphokinase [Anaerolineae bacterium]